MTRQGPAACARCTVRGTRSEIIHRAFSEPFHGVFESSIAVDEPPAEWGQPRATAAPPAGGGVEYMLDKARVQTVEQQPGLAIADAHGTRRGTDRAVLVEELEQFDLAGTDGNAVRQVESKAHQVQAGSSGSPGSHPSAVDNKIKTAAERLARESPAARAVLEVEYSTPGKLMNLSAIALALSLAIGTSAAHAACSYPRAPDNIPDGETATKEQMLAGKKEITRYNEEMNAYLNCIKLEYDGALAELDKEGSATQSDGAKKSVETRRADFERKQTQKHNAAVDEVTAVVDRFNQQLRAYKKKQGG